MLSTLKRTITKSTLNIVEGTTYLCTLCGHIALGVHATSTGINDTIVVVNAGSGQDAGGGGGHGGL